MILERARSEAGADFVAAFAGESVQEWRAIYSDVAESNEHRALRAVNRALLGSKAEAVVRRQIHSALTDLVQRALRTELQRRKRVDFPVSPELLTHYLVSTYISALAWWLNAENPMSPKDIHQAYRHFVLPRLASIFG